MSEVLQAVDGMTLLWATVGCAALCIVGLVLVVLLQFIGVGVELIMHGIDLIGSIIAGGPFAWCGCFLVVLLCAGCGFVTFVMATIIPQCGTPEALRLCRFLGY